MRFIRSLLSSLSAAAVLAAVGIALACTAAGATLVAPGSSTQPPTTVSKAAHAGTAVNRTVAGCGGISDRKPDGSRWRCTFDDEFSGSALNTQKWTPYTSAAGSFRGGAECYDPRQVVVANGQLQLPTSRAAQPFSCAGRVAQYRSGMVTTNRTFAQAYGRFEMRAKLPMSKGLHTAFWLLPVNAHHADGLDYGEIDIEESAGGYRDLASPHLHYVTTPGNLQGGAYCSVPDMAGQWHTYTLVWTPSAMTFAYDGHTCWQTAWRPVAGYQPVGATAPAPFDQPFYLILNMGTDTSATVAANAVSPATDLSQPMQVDYVRVWQ